MHRGQRTPLGVVEDYWDRTEAGRDMHSDLGANDACVHRLVGGSHGHCQASGMVIYMSVATLGRNTAPGVPDGSWIDTRGAAKGVSSRPHFGVVQAPAKAQWLDAAACHPGEEERR